MTAKLLTNAQICALVSYALENSQYFKLTQLETDNKPYLKKAKISYWVRELTNAIAPDINNSREKINYEFQSEFLEQEHLDLLVFKLLNHYLEQASLWNEWFDSLAYNFTCELTYAIAMNLAEKQGIYQELPLYEA